MESQGPQPGPGDRASALPFGAEPEAPAVPVPPPPSIVGSLLLGLAAPLLTSIVAAVLVLFVAACLPGAPRGRGLASWALRSAPGMGAMLLLQNGLIALWAWRLARGRELPARTWLRLGPARVGALDLFLLLVLSAGVFGLGALAAHVGRQLGVPVDGKSVDRLVAIFQSAPGPSWLFLVLAMGAGPGFGEEIWVRGHLLRTLEKRWRTRWAVLGSATVFALLHLDPAHVLFALPFGLVFGWLAVRMDSILPGILCHAVVNSGVNLMRAIEVRRPGYAAELHPQVIQPKDLLQLAALIVAGVVAALWLERRFRP